MTLFFIMGESGSGKDTIYKLISDSSLGDLIHAIISCTTRPMREGEREAIEYYFRDDAHLEQCKKDGLVIESRTYHTRNGDWSYYTLELDDKYEFYIATGTPEQYSSYVKFYAEKGKEFKGYPIYLATAQKERLMRSLTRVENPDCPEICRRFLSDLEEYTEENLASIPNLKVLDANQGVTDVFNECFDYIWEKAHVG